MAVASILRIRGRAGRDRRRLLEGQGNGGTVRRRGRRERARAPVREGPSRLCRAARGCGRRRAPHAARETRQEAGGTRSDRPRSDRGPRDRGPGKPRGRRRPSAGEETHSTTDRLDPPEVGADRGGTRMKRIPTKMEGLDDVLGGGIPDGNVVLVSGAPGTMKTSLTYHILHANALDGVRGLYVSLEQSRASLSILDLGMLRKKLTGPTEQPWMDLFKLYTQGIRKSFDYRLLVLDSLDALEILAKFREPRRDMFSLIHWLRDLHCTAFLLGELPTDSGPNGTARTAYARHKEEYLADGIVHLRLARQGEFGMQRQLRVVKMRGTRHETGYQALVPSAPHLY